MKNKIVYILLILLSICLFIFACNLPPNLNSDFKSANAFNIKGLGELVLKFNLQGKALSVKAFPYNISKAVIKLSGDQLKGDMIKTLEFNDKSSNSIVIPNIPPGSLNIYVEILNTNGTVLTSARQIYQLFADKITEVTLELLPNQKETLELTGRVIVLAIKGYVTFLDISVAPLEISVNDTVSINIIADENYEDKFQVDYGDGTPSEIVANSYLNHKYTKAGQYEIKVRAPSKDGSFYEKKATIKVLEGQVFLLEKFRRSQTKWAKGPILIREDNRQYPTLAFDPAITSDGNGGAIVAWTDRRSDKQGNAPGYPEWEKRNFEDIYAQWIDKDGNIKWNANGYDVCTLPHPQNKPQVLKNSSGKIFFTWNNYMNAPTGTNPIEYDATVYIRAKDEGYKQIAYGCQGSQPIMVSDGNNGFFLVWRDTCKSTSELFKIGSYGLYAQKFTSEGTPLWSDKGVYVNAVTYNELLPGDARYFIINDNSGGLIIAWCGIENGIQRIDSNGKLLWGQNGRIFLNNQNPGYAKVISDGNGGAITTWEARTDIYAQHIDAQENTVWHENGLPVCVKEKEQYYPQIISDGKGGAIITWVDRDGYYAQRINAKGEFLWGTNGIIVCSEKQDITPSKLINDGKGGAIIVWEDCRISYTARHVYAQRIDSNGNPLWANNGIDVCRKVGGTDIAITTDGNSGALITWRGGSNLYIQHVTAEGEIY